MVYARSASALYSMTPQNIICTIEMVKEAVHQIIDSFKYTYSEKLINNYPYEPET